MTNIELVENAKLRLGIPYVYGMKYEVLTTEKYNWLKKTYGDYVWDSDRSKIGQICVDCSGLLSSIIGTAPKSSTMYAAEAKEKYDIATVNDAPVGVAVWRKGHIGIYIGNGKCIEARGSKYGVVTSNVKERDFTHWFYIKDIEYISNCYPQHDTQANYLIYALYELNINVSVDDVIKIAEINNVSEYNGSTSQDSMMIEMLKKGMLKKIS